MSATTLADIKKWVDENEVRCITCGALLTSAHMKYYPHDGGVQIQGMGRLWIYLECPKCGYQNALWKLVRRVSREA